MEKNLMQMPASYAVVAEEEMVYLDGGVSFSDIQLVGAAVATVAKEIWDVTWFSIKSCARSFVEIHLDDLRNPKFQAVLAVTSLAAILSFVLD